MRTSPAQPSPTGSQYKVDAHNARLAAALDATARARVFLLAPGSKVVRKGVTGYQRHATTDHVQITLTFATDAAANIGAIPLPGLFVLDVDVKREKGVDGFLILAALGHGTRPHTLSTDTPNGGRHEWYRLPPRLRGHHVRGKQGILEGVDIIGSTGAPQYVVGVGSAVDGRAYEWTTGCAPATPIAIAPEWLVGLLNRRGLVANDSVRTASGAIPRRHLAPLQSKTEDLDTWCLKAAQWIARKHGGTRVAEGARNAMAARVAGWLIHEGLSGAAAVEVVKVLNQRLFDPPLVDSRFNGLAARLEAKAAATRAPRAELAEIRAKARRTDWCGAAGLNAHKLLLVFLDLARRAGAVNGLEMSDRRSALEAGFTEHRTAMNARHLLIRTGWLVAEVPGQHRGINRRTAKYRLQAGAPRVGKTGRKTPLSLSERERSGEVVLSIPLLNGDQFHRNLVGLDILTALDTGETYRTAAGLARAIHRAPDTVRHRLRRLVACKLARKGPDGWERGPAALELTYTRRDRQRLEHQAERVLHHAELRHRGLTPTAPTPAVAYNDLQAAGVAVRRPLLVAALAERGLLPDLTPRNADMAARVLRGIAVRRRRVA